MNNQTKLGLNQGNLLAILQSAHAKGEKSIINDPIEMIQDLIKQMKEVEESKYEKV
ncbi:hypothetical protein [Bacillus sp. Marseille-P3661]|uniref:hypothetical protein n=1 Tax=Bacillus sp. Marseille-P3661 TaxID=1936234 RepID=UPI0015E1A55E|nr:hypothetical protein [Bacillus sp. Marseille-P3661]